mmetsp:Transcript_37680/g.94738  ORF Transcript_37680/g.94738 Transcript_37680/m.94738 type:complete len:320 (+) Transcript_37680:2220-3179(+)
MYDARPVTLRLSRASATVSCTRSVPVASPSITTRSVTINWDSSEHPFDFISEKFRRVLNCPPMAKNASACTLQSAPATPILLWERLNARVTGCWRFAQMSCRAEDRLSSAGSPANCRRGPATHRANRVAYTSPLSGWRGYSSSRPAPSVAVVTRRAASSACGSNLCRYASWEVYAGRTMWGTRLLTRVNMSTCRGHWKTLSVSACKADRKPTAALTDTVPDMGAASGRASDSLHTSLWESAMLVATNTGSWMPWMSRLACRMSTVTFFPLGDTVDSLNCTGVVPMATAWNTKFANWPVSSVVPADRSSTMAQSTYTDTK